MRLAAVPGLAVPVEQEHPEAAARAVKLVELGAAVGLVEMGVPASSH
jgi:predicted glycosyltransferase